MDKDDAHALLTQVFTQAYEHYAIESLRRTGAKAEDMVKFNHAHKRARIALEYDFGTPLSVVEEFAEKASAFLNKDNPAAGSFSMEQDFDWPDDADEGSADVDDYLDHLKNTTKH